MQISFERNSLYEHRESWQEETREVKNSSKWDLTLTFTLRAKIPSSHVRRAAHVKPWAVIVQECIMIKVGDEMLEPKVFSSASMRGKGLVEVCHTITHARSRLISHLQTQMKYSDENFPGLW